MKENFYNYLPNQYKNTNSLKINHNYLPEQFEDSEEIINDIRKLVRKGDFTLGETVNKFENKFKSITNTKFALGVGSGTDAIFLSLIAAGIEKGDEVITTAYTFYATIGAIVTAGAKPVFVDIGNDYNIDISKIEEAITHKTKAIVPVHWSGLICDMEEIRRIADKHNLLIVEDACHAINAERDNLKAGEIGDMACYSMHPLKNLNVWGDGGILVTNSEKHYKKLALLRNHGLKSRDVCEVFAYNSRLDTLQAIVGLHLFKRIDFITNKRIENAFYFDKLLSDISEIELPKRIINAKQVFHIYVVKAKNRDKLQSFLIKNNIDAKIHYPIPMHLQPAAKKFNYKEGDFPIAENTCKNVISLPVHEYISKTECEYVASKIREFYKSI